MECRATLLPPCEWRPSVGLTATFSRFSAASIEQIRTLEAFAMHRNDSEIFGYLKSRDVGMVDKPLSADQIGPNDRDEIGSSLLWVR